MIDSERRWLASAAHALGSEAAGADVPPAVFLQDEHAIEWHPVKRRHTYRALGAGRGGIAGGAGGACKGGKVGTGGACGKGGGCGIGADGTENWRTGRFGKPAHWRCILSH